MATKIPELIIGGVSIKAGERQVIDVPVAPMYTHDDLSISVQVPSSCCAGYAIGSPVFVDPIMVPPRCEIPRTASLVRSISPLVDIPLA